MPRITPEHAEARRRQILDAARACFLRDGFHQTSMTDIQRESNLSAGAIYLYFKSKDEIILAIVHEILGTIGALIPEQTGGDGGERSLADFFERFLRMSEALNAELKVFPMALQVWSEAIRNPEVIQSLQADIAMVKGRIRRLIEACQERGIVARDVDPDALVMALLGLAQGYIIQRSLLADTTLEKYLEGARVLIQDGGRARPEDPDTN